ncbi:MAG: KH domain-containing protein [Fusobacteria bacterium]|nr:MAG: KH domain-containing protein [Fusobacteriota bacterium]
MENLERLLRYIVTEMVTTEEAIDITFDKNGDLVTFKVRVAEGELGRIIGKNGLTANAIRGVIQAAAVKDRLNVNVEFLD